MPSNRNPSLVAISANNHYTRNDVIRIAAEYQNQRIKIIAKAIHKAGGDIGVVGKQLTPRIKKCLLNQHSTETKRCLQLPTVIDRTPRGKKYFFLKPRNKKQQHKNLAAICHFFVYAW